MEEVTDMILNHYGANNVREISLLPFSICDWTKHLAYKCESIKIKSESSLVRELANIFKS